jgi:hypothetical protein
VQGSGAMCRACDHASWGCVCSPCCRALASKGRRPEEYSPAGGQEWKRWQVRDRPCAARADKLPDEAGDMALLIEMFKEKGVCMCARDRLIIDYAN